MAIESRGIHEYYYRKRRKGARVVSEYVGKGMVAELTAAIETQRKNAKQDAWDIERFTRREFEQRGKPIYDIERLTWDIVSAALVEQGYHTHKGQWRKRQHHD